MAFRSSGILKRIEVPNMAVQIVATEADATKNTINGTAWSQSIDLDGAKDSPSVARLWASRSIADVEAQRWRQGQADPGDA